MIVIYTREKTYICADAEDAKPLLVEVYGEKFGNEAFNTVKNAPNGIRYRRNDGPVVEVVSKEGARFIDAKERAIGMIK